MFECCSCQEENKRLWGKFWERTRPQSQYRTAHWEQISPAVLLFGVVLFLLTAEQWLIELRFYTPLDSNHFRDVLPSQSWRGTQCRVMSSAVREQHPSFISQLVDEETMHLRDWLLSTRASSTWNKNFSLITPRDQEGIWLTQVHKENCCKTVVHVFLGWCMVTCVIQISLMSYQHSVVCVVSLFSLFIIVLMVAVLFSSRVVFT